jgi:hypothetical protein
MKNSFDHIFKKIFESLFGKPAWQVEPGHGSFLTMNFGDPYLDIAEPTKRYNKRSIYVRGEWYLWLYCCDWIVYSNEERVGDASLQLTTKKWIKRAAKFLNGQKLMSASISKQGCSLNLEFDLGGRLISKPYDKKSEQWILYMPKNKTLTVRADRRFQYGDDDPILLKKWKQF